MHTRLLSLLALVALLTGACDGGGLSKSEYIERADAICKNANDQVEEIGTPQNEQELQEFGDEVLAINRRAIEQISDLDPPAEDEENLNQFVALLEEALELQGDLLGALEANDQNRTTEITGELADISQEVRRLTSDYGFEECNRIGLE